jgi:hypothetical protein
MIRNRHSGKQKYWFKGHKVYKLVSECTCLRGPVNSKGGSAYPSKRGRRRGTKKKKYEINYGYSYAWVKKERHWNPGFCLNHRLIDDVLLYIYICIRKLDSLPDDRKTETRYVK